MKRLGVLLAVAVVGLTHPVGADDDGAAKGESQELEGRWIQGQVAVLKAAPGLWKIIYGHELSLDDPTILIKDRSVLSIEGGRITFKNGGHEKSIKIECDPTKSPKAFDLVADEKTRFLGVYEIKDGQLRLCIGDGETRPKKVEYDNDAPAQVFIVFSKLKPPG